MTEEEIDGLSWDELEVAYAEQVLGYVYKPSKTERKPWHRRGYPELAALPHFLGWDYILGQIRILTGLTERWPFASAMKQERFSVEVEFDERGYRVFISLITDDGHPGSVVHGWRGKKSHVLGEAFLRAMLKAAEWFRRERSWVPK